MRSKAILLVAALAVALGQIGLLGWGIWQRASILRNGQEVVLKVLPIDPRDLLRGDYVRLGYDISRIPADLIASRPESATTEGGSVMVRLRRDESDRLWHAVSATLGGAAADAPAEGEVDIRGETHEGQSLEEGSSISVDYGIERFYLPEGEGLAIERDMNVRSFSIVAAVAADGTAQIKALMDGETRLFEEPLY